MKDAKKCTEKPRADFKSPVEPTPARKPSRTGSVKVGEQLVKQMDERGEAVSEPTTKPVARPLSDASTRRLRSRGWQHGRSNPHHPDCDCCGDGATTVGELQELMTSARFYELGKTMRWSATFLDFPSDSRAVLIAVLLKNGPIPLLYAALTVDEARALSEEIAAGPARATFHMGDDLSLSGEELAFFGIELEVCVGELTEAS
jgi:hypothetical protein